MALADAKKLGPVIAYGNFLTITINFAIVAFCIFMVVKAHQSDEAQGRGETRAQRPRCPPT